MNRKKILAILGSTRKGSANHSLITAISALSAENFDTVVFAGIANLPHYNPYEDGERVASAVANFRKQLNEADGVIICTPEYAHGVPGTLKNAIDWTVASSNFSNKPTALITAATDGHFAHRALLETLKVIEAKNVENLQLVIPFIKSKISADDKITDEGTLIAIKALIKNFVETLNAENTSQL